MSSGRRTFDVIIIALLMTIAFTIVSSDQIDNIVRASVPIRKWDIVVKMIIFFVLAYIIDRLVIIWRGPRSPE